MQLIRKILFLVSIFFLVDAVSWLNSQATANTNQSEKPLRKEKASLGADSPSSDIDVASNDLLAQKSATTVPSKTLWQWIKGKPAPNALMLGMWAYHFSAESRRKDNFRNKLIGVIYKGFSVSTFINSHYRRVYLAAIARTIYQIGDNNHFCLVFKYMLGAIYGYKNGIPFAEKSPVAPFYVLAADFSYKKIGVELTTEGNVATVGLFILF